ncbi:helix-turn-helix domain-containing protein [Bacillus halotolerans]|uniref:helix-turn-helix domain-containing protein n=1 Tax=Bacillus subtilis group TaxID=653685 RepID=UPI00227DA1EA|nr:helix-turn-helix domain-containing protein [Bacillus atrophaeus]MCY8988084.1 helix-turn-helix domain-containing protein [Bacillus atrophaeus]MDS9996817.1 helix-turn-helix domain-containing protein [Bacillus atrophaeus]
MQEQLNKNVLEVKDIQEILKIGRNAAYKLVNRNYPEAKDFKVFKFGERGYRIPESSFLKWMNGINDEQIAQ